MEINFGLGIDITFKGVMMIGKNKVFMIFVLTFYLISFSSLKAFGYSNSALNDNKIKVKEQVKKYAVLFPMALPFLFIINAQKNIVAYPGFGVKSIPYFSGNLILKKEPDFIKRTTDIGYPMEPNMEEIVKLHPDFVVDSSFAKLTNRRLKDLGIRIVTFSGSFGNIDDLLDGVLRLGKYTGHLHSAKMFVNYYKSVLRVVKAKLYRQKKHPKVLFLSFEGPSGNRLTAGGRFDTLVNDMIKNAGCVSVSKNVKGMFGMISIEDILKWNPDFIILGRGGNPKEIYRNSLLRSVEAVKEKRVFKVPIDGEKYSNWFAPEKSCLGLLWLAKVTHPNLFKNVNLWQYAEYYYKSFWGLDIKEMKIEGYIP